MHRTPILPCFILITILLMLFDGPVSAGSGPESDSCFLLKVEIKAGATDTTSGPGNCGTAEIHIASDCLSDFTVGGTTLRCYRVVTVTADSIVLARPGDDDPMVRIALGDLVSLNTITWCVNDGRPSWQPATFDTTRYRFSIVRGPDVRMFFARNICWNEACEKTYRSYLHCVTGTECRYIFKRGRHYYVYGMGDAKSIRIKLDK